MDLSERQAEIADLVRENGFMSVDALSERFDVTTQTIRRDLTTLCDFGVARRRHGGLESASPPGNLAYDSRQILARVAKQTIAREVASHIEDGAALAFSIGTTPELVAEALLRHNNLKIFTNNLNIAMLSCRHARSDAFRLWNDHTLETTAGPHQPRPPSPVTRQPGNTSERPNKKHS